MALKVNAMAIVSTPNKMTCLIPSKQERQLRGVGDVGLLRVAVFSFSG